MMQRLLLAAAVVLAANGASPGENPAARFDNKLSNEMKMRQAINRLTFGARPGDLDEIRKLGVEKWIDRQLHPERIPENAALDSKLKPLDSVRLNTAEILTQYYPQFPAGFKRRPSPTEILGAELSRKVFNGTVEERRVAIKALDPEKRMKILAVVPPNVLEGIPELKEEVAEARKKQREEQQVEMRRLRPPLSDLLPYDQQQIALLGSREQRATLYAGMEPDMLRKIAAALPQNALADQPDMRRLAEMSRNPQQVPLEDLRDAKLYRAIYSDRQLEEVLTDFWFNHFNVYEAKGQERAMLANYEREAIRPNVLGKFKDLLLATARHPAMLFYLDNWESMTTDALDIGPFAPARFAQQRGGGFGRQAHGLNENYGRELMELHTLGVNGGYTQQDVIEVARCFTGWSIRSPNEKPQFAFGAFMHDPGEKTVLGHKIPAGRGEQDGLDVIDILVHHPSTARFISTKLAVRFVADNPPPALIERMAKTFTKTDGDIRAVLETMFTSREFFSEGAWESKIKSPLEMVVSAARALDADVIDSFTLAQKVGDMGEPLYAKEVPTGYKDSAETWLSTANVIARMRFAGALAEGQMAGVKVDFSRLAGKDAASMARELLNREPSEQTLAAIDKGLEGRQATPALIAGVVISSPEFQRR